MNLGEVRAALIDGGVTGPHKSHSRASSIKKIHALLEGQGDDFGLGSLERYSVAEVLGFMADLTGCDPDVERPTDDLIDPEKTLEGIIAAATRLSDLAGQGGSLLVGTGHPTGVLEHYIRIVDAFVRAGGKISRLREEEDLSPGSRGHSEVRYIGGVGVLADWTLARHGVGGSRLRGGRDSERDPNDCDHGHQRSRAGDRGCRRKRRHRRPTGRQSSAAHIRARIVALRTCARRRDIWLISRTRSEPPSLTAWR